MNFTDEIPAGFVITTDRRYFDQATAVVFFLPELFNLLIGDLDKRNGQIWVAYHLESEVNEAWLMNPVIIDFFDLRICYRQDTKCNPLIHLCDEIKNRML